MEDQEEPEETDSVLSVKGVNLPVDIAERVLPESGNVLEGSPLLCHITGLSSGNHKLVEVTISLLSKCSMKEMSGNEDGHTCQSYQLSR